MLTTSRTKQVRYAINDAFLRFWFRFIYKYSYLIEIGQFSELKTMIERDYNVFSGGLLEHYFVQKLIEKRQYSKIGGFWDRKGENEIDIIAINDVDKSICFFEVKRQVKRIKMNLL